MHSLILSQSNDSSAPAFRIAQPDGFFVPYGVYSHPLGTQVLSQESALLMKQNFDGFMDKVRRVAQTRSISAAKLGRPVYIGHPDDPLKAAKYPDKRAYGWITGIQPEKNGVLFQAQMSNDGKKLIEEGSYIYYSPFWESAAGREGRIPFRLLSMGLVNDPNIPVPPLSNDLSEPTDAEIEDILAMANDANFDSAHLSTPVGEKENHNKNDMKLNPKLAAMLGLKEESNDDEINGAVDQMNARLAKHGEPDGDEKPFTHAGLKEALGLGNDATFGAALDAVKKMKPAQSNDADVQAKLDEAKQLLAQSNEAATAAKRQRIATSLDLAVSQGRVKIADHGTELERILALSNDAEITTELDKLRTTEQHLKTEAKTKDLAGARDKIIAQANDKTDKRERLLEEEEAKLPSDTPPHRRKELAWQNARRRNPALFR